MNIPEKCYSGRVIPKTAFYEEANLTSFDKKKIQNDITKVRWLYVFKPETINIKKFQDETIDYSEVSFIQVELENYDYLDKIIEIIHKTIQYPLVLWITCNNKLVISIAEKRKNLADSTKLLVERIITSQEIDLENLSESQISFFKLFSIDKFNHTNYYEFYKDIKKLTVSLKTGEYTGKFEEYSNEKSEITLQLVKEIESCTIQISTLKGRIKTEKQLNRQIEINIEINSLQNKVLNLTKQL